MMRFTRPTVIRAAVLVAAALAITVFHRGPTPT